MQLFRVRYFQCPDCGWWVFPLARSYAGEAVLTQSAWCSGCRLKYLTVSTVAAGVAVYAFPFGGCVPARVAPDWLVAEPVYRLVSPILVGQFRTAG